MVLFIILFIFIYYINIGVISISLLKTSLFVFLLISCYKLLLEMLILDKNFKIINYIFFFFNKYILKKNKWLILPIYYILYYFPTNWPYLIILWIGRKWWDIRLYVNSNKDVIGKKYFNKDISKFKFDSKYYNLIKKNIIDIFLRIFFLSTYFKIILITRSWSVFFLLRIFGIIYSTILIINNINIFLLFWNLKFFWFKFVLIFIIIYIYLYFLLFFIENISKKKLEYDIKKYNFNNGINLKWIGLIQMLKENEENFFGSYYNIKNYLLAFVIKDWYELFINNIYNKVYFIKKNNINDTFYFIKLGKIDRSNLVWNKVIKNIDLLEITTKSYNDIIWLYEKNYRYSLFLYGYIFYLKEIIEFQFFKILNNFELFKILFGSEIIEYYFGEEIEEFEYILVIIFIWYEWYYYNYNLENCIPENITNNNNYNKLLLLSKFLSQYDKVRIFNLDYNLNQVFH